jgi:ATP-dependent RNA helicase RhlE
MGILLPRSTLNFSDLNLHPTLCAAMNTQGHYQPTPIQARAIPPALAGQNVVGLAQTGTGKTAAFVLPIVQRLMQEQARNPRALILTPTRELAVQIMRVVVRLSQQTRLRCIALYGGVPIASQERALRNGVDIVVACPGRLRDHLTRGTVHLHAVQTFVLDEGDRMLDMGFLPDIRRILTYLPAERQTLVFSATFPPELRKHVTNIAPDAVTVQIGHTRPAQTIAHALYPVEAHRKTELLLELLHQHDRGAILVFTRTKHRANRVLKKIRQAGHEAACLHSNRTQKQRQTAMDDFRSGAVRVLVATDIAARGIDVQQISHVINYDVPDTSDAYIHRIGRTGRAERSGTAFTLMTPDDSAQVRAIERALGDSLERRHLADFVLTSAASTPSAAS